MNRQDGSVEVAVEGPQEKIDQLRRQIHRGPDGASVDAVENLEPLLEEHEFPFAMRK